MGSRIQLQQRNCFRFSRNSFHRSADINSQRTDCGQNPARAAAARQGDFSRGAFRVAVQWRHASARLAAVRRHRNCFQSKEAGNRGLDASRCHKWTRCGGNIGEQPHFAMNKNHILTDDDALSESRALIARALRTVRRTRAQIRNAHLVFSPAGRSVRSHNSRRPPSQ